MSVSNIQLDPGVLTFNTASKFRSLVIACSQDDVQATAVRAIERVGTHLMVADRLLGNGVDALQGREGKRLQDTRLFFGLGWGGVASQLRDSTPCVRVFLLMTAMKVCSHEDESVADVLYEFMVQAGLFQDEPTSSRQLRDLVAVLSGQGQALHPSVRTTYADVLDCLAILPEGARSKNCFLMLDPPQMARLLFQCFEVFRRDSVDYVEVAGSHGLVWVVTVLHWLNPLEVALFFDGTCLLGEKDARIRIQPSSESTQTWRVTSWTTGTSAIAVLVESSQNDRFDFIPTRRWRIPRDSLRFYLEGSGFSPDEIITIGALAAGLIDILVRNGRIYRDSRTSFSLPLSSVCSLRLTQRRGDVVEDFGWRPVDVQPLRDRFVRSQNYDRSENVPLDVIRSPTYRKPVGSGIRSYRKSFEKFVKDLGRGITASRVTTHIVGIATQAVLAAFQDCGNLVQYYNLLRAQQGWVWVLLNAMNPGASGRVQVCTMAALREQCFIAADMVVHFPTHGHAPLVSSGEGRVMLPKVVVDHSTTLRSLLQMLVLPGGIRLKNEAFDTIHESDGPSSGGSEVDETAEHVMDPGRLDVVLNPAHDPTYFHVEYHFGKDESRLQVLMRTLVVSMSTPPFSRAVTYHQTLESLLFATVHLDGEGTNDSMSPSTEVIPDMLRGRRGYVHLVRCSDRVDSQSPIPRGLVTLIPVDQRLRFFLVHPAFSGPSRSANGRSLYLQQGASVAECLKAIGSRQYSSDKWKLITGYDP